MRCFLRSGPHELFYAKSLTTLDFLLNAKTSPFFTIYFIFLELPLIISSVTECPTLVCFCFRSNFEKFILIPSTRMLDPLWLMKSSTKSLKTLKLSVKKLEFIASERKLKVVNDFFSHRGFNIRLGWIKINFSNFIQNKNKPMLDTLWQMKLLTAILKI